MKTIIFITYIIINFFISSNLKSNELQEFDFNKPQTTHELPKELKEISGITIINDSLVGCVQDELGTFFIYNLISKKIDSRIRFTDKGDFEGVAIAGQNVYALRSDGIIFEILNYNSTLPKITSYASGVPAMDNEGIHYDMKSKKLIIACKGKFGKGLVNQLRREIYAFNPKTKKIDSEPLFVIDIDKAKQFALKNEISLPTKTKSGITKTDLKIRISGLSIHPKTHQFYILSAVDYALFVYSKNGVLEGIKLLNPKLFRQAEGIAFMNNCDLLISNEGGNEVPTVIHLKNLRNN